jgi:hypothetical protein
MMIWNKPIFCAEELKRKFEIGGVVHVAVSDALKQ